MMFNSLFWRLYISILCSLVLFMGIFIGFIFYSESERITEYFYRDTQPIAQEVLTLWSEHGHIDDQTLGALSDDYFFKLYIDAPNAHKKRLSIYQKEARYNDTTIYHHPDTDLLLATIKLPNSPLWLSIMEMEIDLEDPNLSEDVKHAIEQELEYESEEETTVLSLGVILILFIGIVLIYQVRRISQHIDTLVSTSKEWANGQLDARVDPHVPAPLNTLATELNQMAIELNQRINEQQVMTHAISHELRTPLSRMQLATTLLERQHPSLNDEPLLQDLNRYIDELEQLVKQTLTFAKINHSELALKHDQLDLNHLLTERICAFNKDEKDRNSTKEIRLVTQTDAHIIGDRFSLQIVIDNLLKNALKYCNQSVLIKTAIETHSTGLPETIRLTVDDDGSGIPKEKLEKVIMPFARADESRHRSSGGYGLGLAIVDTIVKRHQGTMELSKSDLGGLNVSIQLPI